MVKTRGNIEENNKTLVGLTHMRDETLNERTQTLNKREETSQKFPRIAGSIIGTH